MDITTLTAVELSTQITQRELSAVQVAEAFLARIEQLNGKLGAYLLVDTDGALKAARAVDQKLADGKPVGRLAGVPIGLKDIFVTQGVKTTCGSKILQNWIPPYDGTPTARLKAADAVLLGKLNMDEFAMGSSNENSAYGPCRNPWALDRVPGGSSGGSACAVSARLCAGALGTDTGGSIRQPAALTGTVGIKPTYGRVSRYGVIAFASSLDQVGPMAASAADCALLLEVIAGQDTHDATSVSQPVGNYLAACDRPINGLRIGLPREYFIEGLDPAVEKSVRTATELLRAQGAQLVDVSLPHTPYAVATYYLICTAEASSNLARYDGVRFGHRTAKPANLLDMYTKTREEGFGPEVKRRIMLGTFALSAGYYDAYYGHAQRVRTLIRRDFEDAFKQCDVILTPTTPAPAFRFGEKTADPLQMYLADIFTISCNLAGLPGLSLPCGFSPENLPIGMQLIAPALAEETIFSVAGNYQKHTDWHRRIPQVNA